MQTVRYRTIRAGSRWTHRPQAPARRTKLLSVFRNSRIVPKKNFQKLKKLLDIRSVPKYNADSSVPNQSAQLLVPLPAETPRLRDKQNTACPGQDLPEAPLPYLDRHPMTHFTEKQTA